MKNHYFPKKLILFALFLFSVNLIGYSQCIPSSIVETISTSNTVVNAYYPGVDSVDINSTVIQVDTPLAGSSAGIVDGDLLLVIQMQAALINYSIADDGSSNNDAATLPGKASHYGDGPGGENRRGFIVDANYLAGQYEYVVAAGPVTAGNLTIRTPLQNKYVTNLTPTTNTGNTGTGLGVRTFQVIKVANYNSLTITATGSVTSVPWNGRAGGIVAIDVNNTLTLNGTITTDSQGFRGGYRRAADNSQQHRPGWRGEGIAGRPGQMWTGTAAVVVGSGGTTGGQGGITGYPGGSDGTYAQSDATFYSDRGAGAPGNAGGAGREDASGGGGSNFGSGGDGGAPTANPRFASVGAASIRDIDASYGDGNRLMMGGGGGSGGVDDDGRTATQFDSDQAASGQPGGGIIIIRATETVGTGTLDADGGNGFTQTQEGAGGGGAGGTIFLLSETENIRNFYIYARGGQGSDSNMTSGDAGGGGGGGGLVIAIYIGTDLNNFSNNAALFPEDPGPLPDPITASTRLFIRGGESGDTGRGTTSPIDGTGGLTRRNLPPDQFRCDETLLPITLLSFDGKRMTNSDKVKLWWQTANEIDNKEFWIERSTDAGASFDVIGEVQGKGTIYQTSTYEWIDQEPENVVSYYRLRQVDFSGKYSFTNVIKINPVAFDTPNKLVIVPNPSQTKEVVIYHADLRRGGEVHIIDMLGRKVQSINVPLNASKLQLQLPRYLSKGTYIIKLENERGSWQGKLLLE